MAMRYSSGLDVAHLRQSLFRHADMVDDSVIVATHEAAELIMKASQDRAPVDTHNLEEAHHLVERSTRRGNAAIDIEVSGNTESHGTPVGEYAMYMHEGHYNLGPLSAIKQSGSHVVVGREYLKRAVDEKKDEAIAIYKKALREAIN